MNSGPGNSFSNAETPSFVKKQKLLKYEVPKKRVNLSFDRCVPEQHLIECLKLITFKSVHKEKMKLFVGGEGSLSLIGGEVLDSYLLDYFNTTADDIFANSFEQFEKDVCTMTESISLPLLQGRAKSVQGFIIVNSYKFIDPPHHHGTKQGLFGVVSSVIESLLCSIRPVSNVMLRFLIDQAYQNFEFWELIDISIDSVSMEILMLKDNHYYTPHQTPNDYPTKGDLTAKARSLINLIFGKSESPYRREFEKNIVKESEGKIPMIMDDYYCFKSFISEVLSLDCFKNSYHISPDKLKPPILTVYQVGDKQSKSLYPENISGMFVFCAELEKYVTLTLIKKDGTHKIQPNPTKDKNFYFISYEYAISHINKTTGQNGEDVDCSLIEEPEIGYHSCPLIISPRNTSCKPALYILRDFFNFLAYELNIFLAIKDEFKRHIKTFVGRFCKQFVVKKLGFYCIDWNDFQKFLDEGRSFFEHKLEAAVEKLQKMDTTNKVKPFVKPGILSFHETDEVDNELGNKYYPMDLFTFQSFIKEFPLLCWLVHTQDACGLLGKCALKFHDIFEDEKFCGERKKSATPTVTKQTKSELDDLKKELEMLKVADQNSKKETLKLSELYQECQADMKKELETLNIADQNSKREIMKLSEQNQELREDMKNSEKRIDDLKFEQQKLTSNNEELKAEFVKLSNLYQEMKAEMKTQINELKLEQQKLASVNQKLKGQLVYSEKESEGWKKNYEKVIHGDMMEESLKLIELGINNPVAYYTQYIEQGRRLVQTSRNDLKKFLRKSRIRNDKVRAERELMDFEMTVECFIKKAEANLNILKADQNCEKESLMKVEPYPMPFSPFITSRMN